MEKKIHTFGTTSLNHASDDSNSENQLAVAEPISLERLRTSQSWVLVSSSQCSKDNIPPTYLGNARQLRGDSLRDLLAEPKCSYPTLLHLFHESKPFSQCQPSFLRQLTHMAYGW